MNKWKVTNSQVSWLVEVESVYTLVLLITITTSERLILLGTWNYYVAD